MRKLNLALFVSIIVLLCSSAPRGNGAALTDAQIIKKAMATLKRDGLRDTVILNINKFVEAGWCKNCACPCVYIFSSDSGFLLGDYASLYFDPPIYESFSYGGRNSHKVEKFIEQINDKRSNNIRLKNYTRKDLVITLTFADGGKAVFDAFNREIKETLGFWRREFGPKTKYAFYDENRLEATDDPPAGGEDADPPLDEAVQKTGAAYFGGSGPDGNRDAASVTIPDGVTAIGDMAFSRWGNLTSVVIPHGVTVIGNGAFQDCWNLTSITIPNSVTAIGERAFAGSGLTSVDIPGSVVSIGEEAFLDCGLTSITIPSGVTAIGERAFAGNGSLESLTIPGSVASIGEGAFSRCTDLKSVTIQDGVTAIANWMFFYCWQLESVTVPNSVASIGDDAFADCRSLKSVTLPAGVKSVGYRAFYDCDSLKSVTVRNPVPPATGKGFSFAGIHPDACLYVPANSAGAYRGRDVWKRFKCVKEITPAPDKE